MLMNISAMSSEHLPNLKTAAIHKRMGMTLLYVLKLLQRCLLHKFGLGKISDSLINVGIIIMKAVTLDVFCTWAEVGKVVKISGWIRLGNVKLD